MIADLDPTFGSNRQPEYVYLTDPNCAPQVIDDGGWGKSGSGEISMAKLKGRVDKFVGEHTKDE